MRDSFRIQEQARDYILSHGREITVRIEYNKALGCGGPHGGPCPEVWLGKPAEQEQQHYRTVSRGDLAVYAHDSVIKLDRSILLEIRLEGSGQKSQLTIHAVPNERPAGRE